MGRFRCALVWSESLLCSEDTRMVVDTRDIDLLVQNLLPAAEVQACLKVLPGLYGADACKSDFLSSVAFATNDDALQTEAVAAMISVAWQQMRGTTALDIGLGFLTLAFLIYTSYAHRNAQPLCGAYAVRSSLVFEHCNHCVDLVTADSFMAHILLHPVASSNILPPSTFYEDISV